MLDVQATSWWSMEMKSIIKKTVLAAAALALLAGSPAVAGRQHLNRASLNAARSQGQTAPQSQPVVPSWPRPRLAYEMVKECDWNHALKEERVAPLILSSLSAEVPAGSGPARLYRPDRAPAAGV
jgi:hypothetical protein